MVKFLFQIALLLFVTLFASKKGGKPERHVTTVLLGMFVASTIHGFVVGSWTDYSEIPWSRISLDFFGFILLLGIALKADRWWPLWVASVQLLSVLAHVLRVIDAALPPLVYAVLEQWPFWIAIMITGLGTYLHARKHATGSAS
jgi:hypothetical protein